MSATTVKSNVEKVDINLDEIFNAAPSGADMLQDDTTAKQPKNIFSGLQEKADMSFADPDNDGVDDITAKVEEKVEEKVEVEETESVKAEESVTEVKEKAEDILDSFKEEETQEEETKEKRGRKAISGMSDVFGKLIKDDKIVAFDDDKDLSEYTAKDWEELIEANLEEKAN
jgi:hypothetical protein